MLVQLAKQSKYTIAVILLSAFIISSCSSGPTYNQDDLGTSLRPNGVSIIKVGNRRFFNSNACIEFIPRSPNGHIVFIDPGHGGLDPGTVGTTTSGTTVKEENIALDVAKKLLKYLLENRFTVVMSRISNTSVARIPSSEIQDGSLTLQGVITYLNARPLCADQAHAQILVGIYFDGYYDPSASGCETLYDPTRPFSKQNYRLASDIQQALMQEFSKLGYSVPNRGLINDTQYTAPTITQKGSEYDHLVELGPKDPGLVNTPSEMPGAITEPLFLTNPQEASIAASSRGQHAMATALLNAIKKYFGV